MSGSDHQPVSGHHGDGVAGVPWPLAALVVGFAACAALVLPNAFAAQAGNYAARLLPCVVPAVLGALLTAALVRDRARPLAAASAMVRADGVRVAAGMLGYVLLLASYTTFKTAIPSVVPFYADSHLAAADRALFGGRDAWMLLAGLPSGARAVLHWLYGLPWLGYWILTALVALTMPVGVLRTRYLWAFTLKLSVLGIVAAAAGSSVGPVLYDRVFGGETFAGLLSFMREADGVRALEGADYLYASHVGGAQGVGVGISAFPSVHCAAVFLNALFWGRINRLAGAVAWVFAALIFAGSVLTGWHYAADGLASLAGIAVIWRISGVLSARQDRPLPRRASIPDPRASEPVPAC